MDGGTVCVGKTGTESRWLLVVAGDEQMHETKKGL